MKPRHALSRIAPGVARALPSAVGCLERFRRRAASAFPRRSRSALALARCIRSRCSHSNFSRACCSSKSILKSFPWNSSSPPIRSKMSFKRSKTDPAAEKRDGRGREYNVPQTNKHWGCGDSPWAAQQRHRRQPTALSLAYAWRTTGTAHRRHA